jgi:uncharacterized protein involved in exopolysaccharide biosynthesis
VSSQDIETLRQQRDQARAELARLRVERDQLAMNQLPATDRSDSDTFAELTSLRARVGALSVQARDLQRDLDAHRATISWRITAPLRAFRARGR